VNPESHRTVRESLGAFALGHLDTDEAAGVQAHLDGCADCRAELAELRSVVGPLSRVDPDSLDTATPTPPPDLGDRIVAAARRERPPRPDRRPGGRVAGLVAAGALLVAVAGGAGYLVGSDDGVPREAVTIEAAAPGIDAAAQAIPHTWGVEITLEADGFRPGAVYEVVVVDDAGRRAGAGAFVGTGGARMRCNLNSPVLRADAAGFDVLDDRGAVVVHGAL
jgi:anti-sigma factor RsiW